MEKRGVGFTSVEDPDPHQCDKLDPDPDPHQSKRSDPDPDQLADDKTK